MSIDLKDDSHPLLLFKIKDSLLKLSNNSACLLSKLELQISQLKKNLESSKDIVAIENLKIISDYMDALESLKNPSSSKKYFLTKEFKARFANLISYAAKTKKMNAQNLKIIKKNHQRLVAVSKLILEQRKLEKILTKQQKLSSKKPSNVNEVCFNQEEKIISYMIKKNRFRNQAKKESMLSALDVIEGLKSLTDKDTPIIEASITKLKAIHKDLIKERKRRQRKSILSIFGKFAKAGAGEKIIEDAIQSFKTMAASTINKPKNF